MLLRIGDFSRLAKVSLKTLHHYDAIGLFRPAQVDRFTGYRYYELEQLPRLNQILALRQLGFSLEQVQKALGENFGVEEMRGMLRLRRAQLESDIETARGKLTQVEIRLRWIEQEGKMSEIEVLLKETPVLTVAGAREVVPSPAQMRERCMALNDLACALIKEQALDTDWVSLAIYHASSETGIDVEMAYVLRSAKARSSPDEAVTIHDLPAAQVAYSVYHGSYNDFAAVGQVHAALWRWIEQNGYQVAGPSCEYYIQPPQSWSDPSGVMEIQYPVKK